MSINWDDYDDFSEWEFKCSHTGKVNMNKEFMDLLQQLRTLVGESFIIRSGYRDVTHPVEAKKSKGGTHTQGIACDIQCTNGVLAGKIITAALALGFKGIGLSLKSSTARHLRFIHLDIRDTDDDVVFWSY